jgi:hypothetical protein
VAGNDADEKCPKRTENRQSDSSHLELFHVIRLLPLLEPDKGGVMEKIVADYLAVRKRNLAIRAGPSDADIRAGLVSTF